MIKTASQYHHHSSYERHRIGGHYLDWQNQPAVYKEYPGIDPVRLPAKTPTVKGKLPSVLNETNTGGMAPPLSVEDLSLILRLTHSLTARAGRPGEDFYYRSAASAGALYPTEIYTAIRGVRGLDDGLYYFSIRGHALYPLRIDDLSGYIAGLIFPPPESLPLITFFFTVIFFRSAWKYRDRAYRYHLLDTGHVIENLTLAAKSLGIPFDLSYDFDDGKINHLLGLDQKKEVSLALAHLPGAGPVSGFWKKEIHELSERIKNASIVSKRETDYPAIGEIHRASEPVISGGGDRDHGMLDGLGITPSGLEGWPGTFGITNPTDYPECLFRRRSSRNFIKGVLERAELFAFLDALCSDFHGERGRRSIPDRPLCVGFLANHIPVSYTHLTLPTNREV